MAYDWWWPAEWGALAGFGVLAAILVVLLIAFWVWMLIDCARRPFRNNVEKILWLLIILLGSTLGALIYLVVIKISNPTGLSAAPQPEARTRTKARR